MVNDPRSAATTIFLVRHGLTRRPARSCPAELAACTSPMPGGSRPSGPPTGSPKCRTVDAVYTSPLERARETAAPIGRATGRKPQVERGLLECDFGEWTGASLRRLMRKREWSTVQRAPSSFRFPGGESFTEMQMRIVTALERLRAAHPGGTIVCVSHADPIKAAVAHALGTHLDLFQRIVISPCSISTIAWSNGGPVVLGVNSTDRSLTEFVGAP